MGGSRRGLVFALVCTFVMACVPAKSACGQELFRRWFGDDQAGDMGYSVSSAGDVNGDGWLDVVVGIYLEDHGTATRAGGARVLSGADGSILYKFAGSAKDDDFGWSVANAGDVNGDGYSDIVVGAYQISGKGYLRVFSGKDGTTLFDRSGDSSRDHLGASVAGLGDVNGDGLADFAAGIPDRDSAGTDSGSVRVYSGVDGSTLYTVNGGAARDELGACLASVGDLDGDGVRDFIVSSAANYARVYSAKSGTLLKTLTGDPANPGYFGGHVGSAGDVDGDGVCDLIVGAGTAFLGPPNGQGAAYVYSGKTFGLIYSVGGENSDDLFGVAVSGCGDVDHDGFADFLVGAQPHLELTYAKLFSGRTGRLLYKFVADDVVDQFGYSVAGAGDMDRDGFDDPLIGAPGMFKRLGQEGSATVYRGNDLFLQATPNPAYVGNTVRLDVRNGPAFGTYAILLTEVDGMPASNVVTVDTLDQLGEGTYSDTVPSFDSDHDFTFVAFAIEPAGSHGAVLDSAQELLSVH
jgi:hypothetical protein